MRKAKENVEKHYAVVGVLEELNKTLTVLEHYVPRFFKGAKETYWSECLTRLWSFHFVNNPIVSDNQKTFSKINRNIYKPTTAEVTS